MTHLERLRDEGGFIHKSFIGRAVGGVVSSVIGGVPVVGGLASGLFDRLRGADGAPVAGCPPGFVSTPRGCVPRGATIAMEPRGGGLGSFISRFREQERRVNGRPADVIPGKRAIMFEEPLPPSIVGRPEVPTLAVTGQFGAGFEPVVVDRMMRICPPKTVLGADGICYNRRDLRNSERAWPRGRRPLLTGGEVRAISIASTAAKKLERKKKQLEELGLLKKPATRKAKAQPLLAPGHHAHVAHN